MSKQTSGAETGRNIDSYQSSEFAIREPVRFANLKLC